MLVLDEELGLANLVDDRVEKAATEGDRVR